MDHQKIVAFETILRQLEALHKEITQLAAASPSQQLSAVERRIVNFTLARAEALLAPEELPAGQPVVLPDDADYADAALVSRLFVATLGAIRARETRMRHGKLHWVVEIPPSDPRSREGGREYVLAIQQTGAE